MGHIVAIINNKGGVGKTVTTLSLGHCLANMGHKVLVVDLDTQCNATKILLGDNIETNTLYDIFTAQKTAEDCIYPTPYDNLCCLPNVQRTAMLEHELYQDVGKSYMLLRKEVRDYAVNNFDFCLIDCPPNLGIFAIMSLIAADFVIVPVECGSSFALDGLTSAVQMISDMKKTVSPNLRFLRLLVNKVDLRTSISKSAVEHIRKKFGSNLTFATTIPTCTEFHKAEANRKTIIRFAPKSSGARKYKELAIEFCELVNQEFAPVI
jgi:cellulose biosynthesis protein BcsQ